MNDYEYQCFCDCFDGVYFDNVIDDLILLSFLFDYWFDIDVDEDFLFYKDLVIEFGYIDFELLKENFFISIQLIYNVFSNDLIMVDVFQVYFEGEEVVNDVCCCQFKILEWKVFLLLLQEGLLLESKVYGFLFLEFEVLQIVFVDRMISYFLEFLSERLFLCGIKRIYIMVFLSSSEGEDEVWLLFF